MVECRRSWLYSSRNSTTARRACLRVVKRCPRSSSNSTVEWNDSAAALSSADPVRPIDWVTPVFAHAWANSWPVYSPPWMLSCSSSRRGDLFGLFRLLRLTRVEQVVDLAGDAAFESPKSTSRDEALGGLVGHRVVGGSVVPAGPDHSQPGAGDDAGGVRVAFAASSSGGVEAGRPG